MQDLRYAVRTQRRNPLFALTVIATLAVGIGANTAIFSFVDTMLLRPLPYGDPDRLVMLWQDFSATGGPEREWFTPPDFADVREQSATLDAVAMFVGWAPNLTGAGDPERLSGATVSSSYFSLLGVAPAVGRVFTDQDAAGDGRVVVLSDALWRGRFGADRSIVGGSIVLNGEAHTVVGVMPASFTPPLGPGTAAGGQRAVWRPITPATSPFSAGCAASRGCYVLRVLGRLVPGTPLAQAQAELASIARGIAERFPEQKGGFTMRVVSLKEQLTSSVQPALYALLGGVGMLLLIGCVNIANLMLARAGGREREVALRLAIGAGRGAIVRQLLTESVALGIAGGAAGALLAAWSVDLLVAVSPPGTPRVAEVAVDGRVLGFALLLSVTTGVLFGLAPALQLSRPRLANVLKEGGARSSGARGRMRNALIVAEVAIALTLLAGAGLLIKSFARLQDVDPGFVPENALTVNLLIPSSSYAGGPQMVQFYGELLDRLRKRPGIVAAGASSIVPLSGNNTDMGFIIEGRPLPRNESEAPGAWYRSITPGYFQAMGMRLVRGRRITEHDREGVPPVVVINETMAQRFWPGEDPIGKRIAEGPNSPWVTIVGVVADVRHSGLEQDPLVEMYFPFLQQPVRAMTLVLRTSGDPLVVLPAVREEVKALDPALPLAGEATLEQTVARATALPRLYASFFGFFALVALLLAAIGIYGVTAYSVSQRTQEIGIRMALGAHTGDVLRLVLGQSMLLVVVGVAIGLALALTLSRTLDALLFNLSPTDPVTYASIAVVLALVALLATWLPARRAAHVDPIVTLRTE